MSAKHTPGPWRTVPFICHGSSIGIQDADGKWIGEEGYAEVQYIPRFNPEHARRIVACVNACKGLQTDLLESIAMMGDTLASRFKLRDETERELQAQRDALLAKLKVLTRSLSYEELMHDDQRDAFKQACAAIAKAIG